MPVTASTCGESYHNLLKKAKRVTAKRVRYLVQRGRFPGATCGPCRCTALHAAAELGDGWVVPKLVAAGFDPNARTTDGRTPLSLAASRRDLDVVAALLKGGASVHAADSSGNTPLHVAAGMGYAAMIQALLAAGASVQAANNQGNTPLHMACIGDHTTPLPWRPVTTPYSRHWDPRPNDAARVHVACELLGAGADVEARSDEGNTPLQLACKYGHRLLMDVLLSRGAQPTTQNKRGWSALHLASWFNQTGVVSGLLQLSEVKGQLEVVTLEGQTALVLACWNGADQVVPLLLAAGADVHALAPSGLRPLHAAVIKQQLVVLAKLLAAGADPSAVARNGQSALQIAAAAGHKDTVEMLLAAGADASAVELHGPDALHLAAAAGHRHTAEMLLAGGADPHAVNQQQRSALHVAVAAGHWDTVQVLLEGGSNLAAVDRRQHSALHLAAAAGQREIVPLLLAAGADAFAVDRQQQSVLHVAAAAGQREVVQLLLEAGATPGAVDQQQQQDALHAAAAAGHWGTVQVLLAGSADPHAVNQQQQSVLHVAAAAKRWAVVPMLLAAGADPCALDQQQQSVLHVAVAAGHRDTVQVLLAAGAQPGAVDQQRHNALDVAATAGDWTTLQLLLTALAAQQRSVSVRAMVGGVTALHLAIQNKQTSCVEGLLAVGADPCTVNHQQQHALHVAAAAGDCHLLQMLLTTLAPSKRNSTLDAVAGGMTALHLAIQKRHTSCVEALMSAGADANKLLGPGAVDAKGVSMEGASPLLWAVVVSHAGAIHLLANPASLRRRTWRGQTPLHQALYGKKADMAQLLIVAGSPAGVIDDKSSTAIDLAVQSSRRAVRALLPAMVRGECALHQQQLQQEKEGDEGQLERAAVPDAVEDVVHGFLRGWLAASEELGLQRAVPCISMVLDVLGPTAASRLMQKVLHRWTSPSPGATNRCGMQLLRLAHTGWLSAMGTLLHRRQTVTSRLQWLVMQPLQQQQEEYGAVAANDKQPVSFQQLTAPLCKQLWTEVLAAGDAGQWGLLVQCLEQLAGLQPADCRPALFEVAEQKGWVRPPAVVGLCEALLGAWASARQQAAGKVVQEVTDGVLHAVQAWEQQRAAAVHHVGSSRRGL